jgi:hemerythrin
MQIFKNLLISKLKEKNLEANLDIYFDKLFKYIKAWFFTEEQLMNYIHDDKIKIVRDNDSEAIKKENIPIIFLITKDEIDKAKKLFDVIKIGNEAFDQLCN